MPDVEVVNPVPATEAEPWMRQLVGTLLHDPYADDFPQRVDRWRSKWIPERTWAARERGRYVGTLSTEPRILTVPDGAGATTDLTVDALTAVSVAATHRRRGLLTTMLTQSLRAAKERGDALSVLIAAEWPIYGRFGYAPAVLFGDYTYRTRMRGATIDAAPSGSVRQIEAEEVAEVAPLVFERARRLRAGQVDRPGEWWPRTLGVGFEPLAPRRNWVLHEGADGPDGLLDWRVHRDFELDGTLGAVRVESFAAADAAAHRNLWAYLGALDVIEEVQLPNLPVDEPARYLMANGRALRQDFTGDMMWLALLDVPGALASRGYVVEGRLVLDVVDDSLTGYASGRVELDASGDGVSCSATTRSADLTLPAHVLAGAYLGGHSVCALALAGGVDEHRSGSLRRLDAMLHTGVAPWCQTFF